MLADAVMHKHADRTIRGKQVCRRAYLFDGYPGNCGGFFRSKLCRQSSKACECRLASDSFPFASGNGPLTEKRERCRVTLISATRRVIEHRTIRVLVPGDKTRSRAVRRQIRFGKRRTGIAPHQKSSVRPLAHEALVEESLFDHHVDHRQCERAVGARTDLQKNIGLSGDADAARIDGNDLHAALSRGDDVMREDQRCRARVMTPEQKGTAMRHIWRWNFHPEGISEPRVFVPIADVSCGDPVRAAEAV